MYARHGGLPGDRPGRRCSGRSPSGRSASTTPAASRSRRDGLPPGDHAAGRARSTSTCPATSWARRWTRASVALPRAGAADRRARSATPARSRRPIALLAKAERPLIIGGSGVWWSDAAAAFQAFVEATGMPFYTTPHVARHRAGRPCAGLPERPREGLRRGRRHPEHRHAVQLRRSSSCEPPRFAANLKVIQVDINPAELGHNRPSTCPSRATRAPCSSSSSTKPRARSIPRGTRPGRRGSASIDDDKQLEMDKAM